ncbi:hypothetical protein CSKR_112138 [Clonorchis sinensis]|uniref:Uncharacterized protein n=1 Tax=Clonorchis sinensis TaxID=79923 RepID=A0A419PM11_CLOSI|nr:hypothetical protein CSKR_112138 [Clonorchis sinensis]
MKRPGAAHSVAWKHHKREIQLGSRLTETRGLRLPDEPPKRGNGSWAVEEFFSSLMSTDHVNSVGILVARVSSLVVDQVAVDLFAELGNWLADVSSPYEETSSVRSWVGTSSLPANRSTAT